MSLHGSGTTAAIVPGYGFVSDALALRRQRWFHANRRVGARVAQNEKSK